MPASAARGIEVTGLRELRSALKRVDAELPRELARINQRAAEIPAARMRQKAPVGPHQGGGNVQPIAQSVRAGRQQAKGVVSVGGARSPHALVANFGGTIPRRGSHRGQVAQARAMHQSFRRFGGISVTRVRGREYIYSSLAATRDEVVEFYGGAVGQLMSRAFPG